VQTSVVGSQHVLELTTVVFEIFVFCDHDALDDTCLLYVSISSLGRC